MSEPTENEKPSRRARIRSALERHVATESSYVVGQARLVGKLAVIPICRTHIAVVAAGEKARLESGALAAEPLAFVTVREDGRAQLHPIPEGTEDPEEPQAEADPAAQWAEFSGEIPGFQSMLEVCVKGLGWDVRIVPPQKRGS